MAVEAKRYIGDGVYAAFDGFALTLTTENGIEVTNTVVFEPKEWAALERYVTELRAASTAVLLELAAIGALKEEQSRDERDQSI